MKERYKPGDRVRTEKGSTGFIVPSILGQTQRVLWDDGSNSALSSVEVTLLSRPVYPELGQVVVALAEDEATVEHVARALAENYANEIGGGARGTDYDDCLDDAEREEWRMSARAAIKALIARGQMG